MAASKLPKQGETRTVMIEKAELEVRYELLPVDKVRLDPDNPRVRYAVRKKTGRSNGSAKAATPAELTEMIWEMGGVQELFKSVRDNGGLIDPIYVRADGVVAEGNCRIVVYKKLFEKTKNSHWTKIPTFRLPDETTPRQIAVLQGQFHVAGKTKWRAAEEAGHMFYMNRSLHMTYKEIAAAIGLTETDVERHILAYETLTDVVMPLVKNGTGMEKFSHLYEFFKNRKLEELRKDPKAVKKYATFIAEGKIEKGADVRGLPKILKSKRATKVLERSGYKKAIASAGKADPTADSSVFRKIANATKALDTMRAPNIERLKTRPKEQNLLKELYRAVTEIAEVTRVKLR